MAKKATPRRKSSPKSRKRAASSKKASASGNQVDVLSPGFFERYSSYILIGILLLTALVYLPTFDNDLTNWDDKVYINDNTLIKTLDGEHIQEMFATTTYVSSNYHPLTLLLYAINYQMSGLDSWSYILTQILFHLLNTFLVFRFVLLLTEKKKEIALFVALFFAIHPMHVESVAWISEHKDVLYTCFFLLGLNAYLKYISSNAYKYLAFAFGFLVLSLLSKSAAAAFPVAMIAIDYWKRRPLDVTLVLEKVPFFLLAALFGYLALESQSDAIATENYTLFQRVQFACYGFTMYIVKLFVPYGLSSFYAYPPTGEPWPLSAFLITIVTTIGIVGLTVFTMRKTRIIAFGMGFYLATVALVLQFLSVGGAVMGDRYTYVPYIGLLFILGYGLYLTGVEEKWKRYRKPALAVILLGMVTFSYISFERIKVWKNSETLWSDVIEKNPKCGRGWMNRGVSYFDDEDLEQALLHFTNAVKYRATLAHCWFNRGLVLNKMKRYEEAVKDFDQAIARKANYHEAYHHRGTAYSFLNQHEKAMADYNKTLSINPNFEKSYNNRGRGHYLNKDYEKALADFQQSIRLNPSNTIALSNLGAIYLQLNRPQEAVESFTKAIKIDPNNRSAYGNRAIAYDALGQAEKAKQDRATANKLGQ